MTGGVSSVRKMPGVPVSSVFPASRSPVQTTIANAPANNGFPPLAGIGFLGGKNLDQRQQAGHKHAGENPQGRKTGTNDKSHGNEACKKLRGRASRRHGRSRRKREHRIEGFTHAGHHTVRGARVGSPGDESVESASGDRPPMIDARLGVTVGVRRQHPPVVFGNRMRGEFRRFQILAHAQQRLEKNPARPRPTARRRPTGRAARAGRFRESRR